MERGRGEVAIVGSELRKQLSAERAAHLQTQLRLERAVEALRVYRVAQAMPTWGDNSGYQAATYTYEKSFGGGECSKHGRYYGSCASCHFELERFRADDDMAARRKRDIALREADDVARSTVTSDPPAVLPVLRQAEAALAACLESSGSRTGGPCRCGACDKTRAALEALRKITGGDHA